MFLPRLAIRKVPLTAASRSWAIRVASCIPEERGWLRLIVASRPVLTPTHRVDSEQPLGRPLRLREDALGLVPIVLERRLQFATAFRVTAAGDVPIYQRGGCLRRRVTRGQQIEEQKLKGLGVGTRCVEHRTSPGRPPLTA